ncbi:response regulator transcription factor [Paenibacillus arenilitoris]|uniref:Response regulator n=1 Tax=Paenibacillus arenilitoris TaxID=2772299 RepID=A0A927H5E0_9BACL|nr:response regulator [Paenibacillus arenilitoris]MBD2868850.1 response regulator [Paenibacillus arenilitoris]
MKLLVVDDEIRHRKGMVNMIRAIRPDYKLYAAKNGTDALEIVRSERPEIVLTDIRMPGMDGLAFLENINSLPERPRVVFLSAYNLFEYAQSAIRHNAFDYLLKPVDQDKVEATLNRIEAQLHKESGSTYNAILHAWLSGRDMAEDKGAIAAIKLLHGGGYAAVTEISAPDGQAAVRRMESYRELLERTLSPFGPLITIPAESRDGRRSRLITLIEAGELPQEEVRRALRFADADFWRGGETVAHGFGEWTERLLTGAPDSYRTARQALVYAFYESWHGIVWHDASFGKEGSFGLDTELVYEAIAQQGNERAAFGLCKEAFEGLAQGGRADPAHVRKCASLTVMKLKSRTRHLLDQAASDRLNEAALTVIPASPSFAAVLRTVEECLQALGDVHSRSKRGRGEFVAESCIKLIQTRYMDDLTLESVSEMYHFNASYFSTLFRSATGKTFSELLIETRLNRAKELLSDASCNLKIYAIAEQCGYRDSKYFCRLFRKHTGVSPEVFRGAALSGAVKGVT